MNKRIAVRDLKEKKGSEIRGTYFLSRVSIKKTQAGKEYIDLDLEDKTGTINGKIWNINDKNRHIKEQGFVYVKGVVDEYRGSAQLKLEDIEEIDSSEIDIRDFQRHYEGDLSEVWQRIVELVNKCEKNHYCELLSYFFDDGEFKEDFMSASAAVFFHHAYKGGLAVHTATVAEWCDRAASVYGDFINREALITSAILHDIGKIWEIDAGVGAFRMSTEGKLLGHVAISFSKIDEAIKSLELFPKTEGELILHCVLSHHGLLEWGSPVEPACPEAVILHQMDNLDAKIIGMKEMMESEQEKNGDWTSPGKNFKSGIFMGKKKDIKEEEGSPEKSASKKSRKSKIAGKKREIKEKEGNHREPAPNKNGKSEDFANPEGTHSVDKEEGLLF